MTRSRDDQDEAAILGELYVRMARCWESIRTDVLRDGTADEPPVRRAAVLRHLESWLQHDGESTDLLRSWLGLDDRTRNALLDDFSDPAPLDIIGFTCDRCGAFDPQPFDSDQQVCGACGWIWVRPKGP